MTNVKQLVANNANNTTRRTDTRVGTVQVAKGRQVIMASGDIRLGSPFPAIGPDRFAQFDDMRDAIHQSADFIEVVSYAQVLEIVGSDDWRMPPDLPDGLTANAARSMILAAGEDHHAMVPWLVRYAQLAVREADTYVKEAIRTILRSSDWPLDPTTLCAVPVTFTGHLLGILLDPRTVRTWGIIAAQSPAVAADSQHPGISTVNDLDLLVNRLSSDHPPLSGAGFCQRLRAAVVSGELTHAQSKSILVTIVIAGGQAIHEAILSILYSLGKHSRELDLSSERARRAFITETMRLFTPSQYVVRDAVRPTVLDGHPITAATRARLWLAAANRDPKVFDSPHTFEPGRSASALSFGRGAHACLGASLTYTLLDQLIVCVRAQCGQLMLASKPGWTLSDLAFSPVGFLLARADGR